MTVVAYITHPIGERDAGFGADRGDNLANGAEWCRFVKDVTGWAVCAPWFGYVAFADSDFYRRSWLTDMIAISERCDVLVLTGGRMNPHMRIELDHAQRSTIRRVPVLDLLDLGRLPPWNHKDEIGIEIRRRAEALGL